MAISWPGDSLWSRVIAGTGGQGPDAVSCCPVDGPPGPFCPLNPPGPFPGRGQLWLPPTCPPQGPESHAADTHTWTQGGHTARSRCLVCPPRQAEGGAPATFCWFLPMGGSNPLGLCTAGSWGARVCAPPCVRAGATPTAEWPQGPREAPTQTSQRPCCKGGWRVGSPCPSCCPNPRGQAAVDLELQEATTAVIFPAHRV